MKRTISMAFSLALLSAQVACGAGKRPLHDPRAEPPTQEPAANMSVMKSEEPQAPKAWDIVRCVMCFDEGDVFAVDGPLTCDGHGEVSKKDAGALSLRIDIPQRRVLLIKTPGFSIEIELRAGESGECRGKVTVDSKTDGEVEFEVEALPGREGVVLRPALPQLSTGLLEARIEKVDANKLKLRAKVKDREATLVLIREPKAEENRAQDAP